LPLPIMPHRNTFMVSVFVGSLLEYNKINSYDFQYTTRLYEGYLSHHNRH
jgi:hypothetical protein